LPPQAKRGGVDTPRDQINMPYHFYTVYANLLTKSYLYLH